MGKTSMFNVRVDVDLDVAIEEAAERAGLRKSVWAREVLGAVALGGVSLETLADLVEAAGRGGVSPHPSRYLPLLGQTGRQERLRAECAHPKTGLKRLPFSVICGVCGETVKRT